MTFTSSSKGHRQEIRWGQIFGGPISPGPSGSARPSSKSTFSVQVLYEKYGYLSGDRLVSGRNSERPRKSRRSFLGLSRPMAHRMDDRKTRNMVNMLLRLHSTITSLFTMKEYYGSLPVGAPLALLQFERRGLQYPLPCRQINKMLLRM